MYELQIGIYRTSISLLVSSLVMTVTEVPVCGQWAVTNLHPENTLQTWAQGVWGGQQGGFAIVGIAPGQNSIGHACVWNGSAASYVDLNPIGAAESAVGQGGVAGGNQFGFASFGGSYHAGMWSGTAASWVDLHPRAATWSEIYAASLTQQVGYVHTTVYHASLWNGSSESWVDLNPAGGSSSFARAVSDGQQGGWVTVNNQPHASLWSGTASSWVDLHPAGATKSYVLAISGVHQFGQTYMGVPLASMWTGTAASWVSLHPADASSSWISASFGDLQAGTAVFANHNHASIWSGTAASWMDLHTFLSADYYSSNAQGIWSDADHTFVVGRGFNSVTQRTEALLWTYTAPKLCTSDVTGNGTVDIDDLLAVIYAWGPCPRPPAFCPADIVPRGGNSVINIDDLLAVINAWGACP